MNIKKRILVQNRLQQLYRFGIIVLVSLLIVACQPSYTVDQTKLVGREIGLMDKYSISRQHSRVINAHSHLSVITKPIEDQKDGRICAVVAGSFQPYFGSVNCARDLGTLGKSVV